MGEFRQLTAVTLDSQSMDVSCARTPSSPTRVRRARLAFFYRARDAPFPGLHRSRGNDRSNCHLGPAPWPAMYFQLSWHIVKGVRAIDLDDRVV
jgi:hypothetical protein